MPLSPSIGRALFWTTALTTLVLVVWRAAVIPLSHDEVATFYFYIQTGDFWPFLSHPDANGHFLNSALAWICWQIFGDSPLSLRLPNVAAYLLLCFAVARTLPHFGSAAVQTAYSAMLLLTFTFTGWFSMCRGYGLSMAFLALALCNWLRFSRTEGSHRHFLVLIAALQLALAANLTLIFAALVGAAAAIPFHIRKKTFTRPAVVAVYLVHLFLTGFWVLFAFYLNSRGALYYGAGEDFWKVTFGSLLELLFGDRRWVTGIAINVIAATALVWVYGAIKSGTSFLKHPATLALLMLAAQVTVFYLLKIIAGINYPEDRTALFFYVFFVFSLCLVFDTVPSGRWKWTVLVPATLTVAGSIGLFSFLAHPYRNFETMPVRFFDRLVLEEKTAGHRITVAGQNVREFFYGFLNYRSEYKLNHITSPTALQMNCDYALAVAADEPWYRPYYAKIDRDEESGFRLLKRKIPLTRVRFLGDEVPKTLEGNHEFFNCLEFGDTLLDHAGPLEAQVTFSVESAPAPFHGWLVLQVEGPRPEDGIFVRAPLDLIAYDWNRQEKITLCLTTGNVPRRIDRMVLYFWNIKKETVRVRVLNSRLVRLVGEGAGTVSKARL